ncbi:MAG: hypothetical protein IJA73_01055 [Oscillospiraceae bacterium]|nr:hypothetical protein [Oscillospiraceae bacterium]
MKKSCFFIGHHDTGNELCPLLAESVERHITEYGVTDFFVGDHGNFDSMAAAAVAEAKTHHPEVCLTLVLAYHPAERTVRVPNACDSIYYPWEGERILKRYAIVKTNRYMVQTCSYLIANAWHHFGGTGQIVDYARKREMKGLIKVSNLSQKPNAL